MLDIAAMREALAIGRARQRADGDARRLCLTIFARVLVVVVRRRSRSRVAVAISSRTIAFEGRRGRRPLRAARESVDEKRDDYCVFGMHVASAPAAAKHVEPWMQSVSVWQG